LKRESLAALLLLVVIAFAAFPAGRAHADGPATDAELQVERQLGCPICTNLPLNVCDNPICESMKGVIRQQLAEGQSQDQIVAYFVSRYGDGVLLTPPQRGFNLAVWYLPFAAILVGTLIVWGFVRRSVRRHQVIDQRLQPSDATLGRYRERVRRQVKELEEPT
jgi:cytochrome c-type biogenesis protein CcmH